MLDASSLRKRPTHEFFIIIRINEGVSQSHVVKSVVSLLSIPTMGSGEGPKLRSTIPTLGGGEDPM
jgi:hypothetical protein